MIECPFDYCSHLMFLPTLTLQQSGGLAMNSFNSCLVRWVGSTDKQTSHAKKQYRNKRLSMVVVVRAEPTTVKFENRRIRWAQYELDDYYQHPKTDNCPPNCAPLYCLADVHRSFLHSSRTSNSTTISVNTLPNSICTAPRSGKMEARCSHRGAD